MSRFSLFAVIFALGLSNLNAQTGNKTVITNIGIDSLKTIVKEHTGLQLYFNQGKGDDSLKLSFDFYNKDLIKELSNALANKQYSVTKIGNNLYILKGVGISTSLPKDYFLEQKSVDSNQDYLNAITFSDNTASFENKIYRIGDPNSPKKDGRALLRGYVKNQDSGEPIAGVSVMIDKTQTVVTTDAFGFYRILIPTGSREITLRGYGLEDSRLILEVFGDGEMDIIMKDKVYSLKKVVLTAESTQKMRSTQMGLERVRIDRIKHVPAAFGEADVMKIVLTLPGVKSVGESSGGFNVRGGATDQNLILFNDGTIYNPTHLFGLFSAFNPDVVNDIELYKSTIPAKYGGRISSVLEINSRSGNSNKITGSAGLGLLTSKFHIEGPIVKEKTNFIAGIRTTYSNWILGLLPKESGYKDGTASFQDITLGLSHKFNNSNTLYAYGYYSGDGFKFSPDTSFFYRNMNASLKWRRIISDKHNLLVSTGYDNYYYKTEEKGNPVNAYNMKFNIKQFFLKANFNLMLNEKHSVNYGLNSTFYNLNPGTPTPIGQEAFLILKRLK